MSPSVVSLRNTCFEQPGRKWKTVRKGLQNRVCEYSWNVFLNCYLPLTPPTIQPSRVNAGSTSSRPQGLCCSFSPIAISLPTLIGKRVTGITRWRIPNVVGSADMEWIERSRRPLITELTGRDHDGLAMRFDGEISIRCFMREYD